LTDISTHVNFKKLLSSNPTSELLCILLQCLRTAASTCTTTAKPYASGTPERATSDEADTTSTSSNLRYASAAKQMILLT
jgi:hypothetical protein